MTPKKRILVIGAGASGLVSIKSCKEEGLDVICYEKTDDIGGVWRYRESANDDVSSVMKTTVANSSKEMSAFSDFPPSEDFPIYLPHEIMLKYFELYADHFDLRPLIKCNQEVVEIIPAATYCDTGQWLVKVRDLLEKETREQLFDGIMVCSGHHTYPLIPPYKNLDLFAGKVIHSHQYKTFKGFEDKVVLVVGAGNSGADIAVELSNVAKKVYLSTRRGVWIYPRYLKKGKPLDVTFARRSLFIQPAWIVEKKLRKMLTWAMDHKKFGIQPNHRVLSQHPTVNDDLKCRLASKSVILKKDVLEFFETGAQMEGENEPTQTDVVIFATGYMVKFPFINEDIIRIGEDNAVYLYKNVFPPQLKHPSLAIIGLTQPNGSLFPVFEIQARWFASLMAGKCQLPRSEDMFKTVRKEARIRERNYVQSARHAVEINKISYMDEIAKQFGAKPRMAALLFREPQLFWACFMGPCLPYQYRLFGPHKFSDARQIILSYKSRMYGFLKGDAKKCEEKVAKSQFFY